MCAHAVAQVPYVRERRRIDRLAPPAKYPDSSRARVVTLEQLEKGRLLVTRAASDHTVDEVVQRAGRSPGCSQHDAPEGLVPVDGQPQLRERAHVADRVDHLPVLLPEVAALNDEDGVVARGVEGADAGYQADRRRLVAPFVYRGFELWRDRREFLKGRDGMGTGDQIPDRAGVFAEYPHGRLGDVSPHLVGLSDRSRQWSRNCLPVGCYAVADLLIRAPVPLLELVESLFKLANGVAHPRPAAELVLGAPRPADELMAVHEHPARDNTTTKVIRRSAGKHARRGHHLRAITRLQRSLGMVGRRHYGQSLPGARPCRRPLPRASRDADPAVGAGGKTSTVSRPRHSRHT